MGIKSFSCLRIYRTDAKLSVYVYLFKSKWTVDISIYSIFIRLHIGVFTFSIPSVSAVLSFHSVPVTVNEARARQGIPYDKFSQTKRAIVMLLKIQKPNVTSGW